MEALEALALAPLIVSNMPFARGQTMSDDRFTLWLGRVGQDRPFAHRMRGAVNRAGGAVARKSSTFTGARIGRGSGVGRLIASRGSGPSGGRRVVVKARIVKLAGKGAAGAVVHHRGMADGLQHRASAQQPWRVGTRQFTNRPRQGHMDTEAKLPAA